MDLTVILSTYDQPQWLEKVLWGYAAQTDRSFELLVADDGSGPETRAVIEGFTGFSRLSPIHVWHPDEGFQKSVILNRAIAAATGDYLLFSDGDCIPRSDFVATHRHLARRGRFLSGGALKMPAALSGAISREDIESGRFASFSWLKEQGFRPGRRVVRLLPAGRRSGLLDMFTPTRASWNGLNASTWKSAAFEVNGFEAEMRYGGQDRAFGERLQNMGYRGIQVRHRAVALHLHHERPYKTSESMSRNREIRARIQRTGETRASVGVAELTPALSWEAARRGGGFEEGEQ